MSDLLSRNKRIVVSVSAMNKDSIIEALRMAVGISTGRRPFYVSLLFSGDGVINGVKDRVNEEYDKYYTAAQAHNVALYIDEFCMSLRGLKAEVIRPEFQIIKREEILSLLAGSDLHVRL
ncbi:MAG: DsrE family protein [bacterium]|nr:DsrE family protein [bacterium]